MEYKGKNLESILQEISEKQKVTINDIKYQIKEENKGFLGINRYVIIDAYTTKDVENFIIAYLQKYFDHFSLSPQIKVEQEHKKIKVQILNLENKGLFIGKNGSTLSAMETILQNVVAHQFSHRFNVELDIDNYNSEHITKMLKQCDRLADEVINTKASILLDPMDSKDRKMIHQHLRKRRHIKTQSEGEGKQRRLRISYVS